MGNINLNITNNINNNVTNSISSVIQQTTTHIIQNQVIGVKCDTDIVNKATESVGECINHGIDRGIPPDDILKLCNFNPCKVEGVTQIQFLDIKLIVNMSTSLQEAIEQKVADSITNVVKDNGGFNINGLNKSVVTNITNATMNAINSITNKDIDDIKQVQRITGQNVTFVNVTQNQSGKFILDKLLKSDSYVKAVQDVSTKISQRIKSKRNMTLIAILVIVLLIIVVFVGYKMWKRKKRMDESPSSMNL